ncbi:coiled-coil domain-containing protein [Streptomyces chiangmaiensis]|uniref:Cellulose-binding protein n=1 Tax=Streptomyces chiangmaiensis TaxID=766497 RepID=A0ABU7FAM4_9ACTN|nr:cellulose-binding protein [Streptomyces chiangmaiensis]MED7821235.1 cellulose-binding protein [Streptomyces chiangmaiensis]
MSSAAGSPHGFVSVRRGYRPDQVDAYTAALSQDRDAAWERAARLTVLAREMEVDLVRLRETVAQLDPQTYEALGDRARRLFDMAQEEAVALREDALREARDMAAEAEEAAAQLREAAKADADEVRAEAEERVRTRLLAARAEADDVRILARREVKEGRGEALAALREVRQRTETLLAEQEREHAERWEGEERAAAARAAALDAAEAERVARVEAALSQAKQAFAEAEESARRIQRDAKARAAEVIADARLREERIARETERVLREHGEQWDCVQAQMDHVRNSLAMLTGRAAAE